MDGNWRFITTVFQRPIPVIIRRIYPVFFLESQVILVAQAEEVGLEEDGAQALVRISQGDLRKALTALQVAAALNKEKITKDLVYETTATAPPESLQQYMLSCKSDGFHVARRRMREILDKFGLAGTDFVNQLHRELYQVDFLSEPQKLEQTLQNLAT